MPGGSPAITAAVFRAVRTGNAFEETVERLLEGVKLGVYAPGDRLPPERELTRRLGISRITLREALRELAAAGYVETKRGRFGGTFILRQPEPMVYDELTRTARDMGGQLDDALTFRRVVETGAAEMAARASLTRQQRENLAECLATVHACEPSGYRQADTRLHLAIADAAGSPMLTASVVEARVQLVDLLNAIPMLGRNLEHANVQHASIVRAILAGDPDRARRAMEEHVAGTAALLRGFLSSPPATRSASTDGEQEPWSVRNDCGFPVFSGVARYGGAVQKGNNDADYRDYHIRGSSVLARLVSPGGDAPLRVCGRGAAQRRADGHAAAWRRR